ncbi:cytochrome c-type biogenesis protein CcmH [Paracoccaceae bacterium]|nr:cytochrome c-type biogenesis protein CcmH [Paracoccaceae bacterium]
MKYFFFFLFAFFIASRAIAVEPSEILANSQLEDRARKLSSNIRCLVCQNENIDSSDSEFAKDIRLFIRDQLVEGRSDREIEKFLVSKYGTYILFKPQFVGYNIFLYLFGPFIFILGIGMIFFLFLKSKKGN